MMVFNLSFFLSLQECEKNVQTTNTSSCAIKFCVNVLFCFDKTINFYSKMLTYTWICSIFSSTKEILRNMFDIVRPLCNEPMFEKLLAL